ncbi:MAG: M28 family peptidase [Bacteroidales bacterium]|nr:M28 family peptidase [Bacteroidales bacterium]
MWVKIQVAISGLLALIMICSCKKDGPERVLTLDETRLNELCTSKFNGRRAGTEGCDNAARYLIEQLESSGYEVFVQQFRFKDAMDLKNIYVMIPGKSDSLLVVGAHYDGAVEGKHYQAADDNGSGVVTLLSVCEYFSHSSHIESLHYSVIFAFWAAEELTKGTVYNGSRYFVSNFKERKKIRYYCNLDCFARKGQDLMFYYSPSASYVLDRVGDYLHDYMTPGFHLLVKESEKMNSDHVSFGEKGIPFFGWNDINTSGFAHTKDDSVEKISFDKIRTVSKLTSHIIESL